MPRPEDDFADSDPAGRDHPTPGNFEVGRKLQEAHEHGERIAACYPPRAADPVPAQTEYQQLAEHLSKLGLEREQFVRSRETATSFGIDPHPMEGMLCSLLRGQAQIMGALALFARDYDPELYVHTTTSSDTMFGGVRVEPGSVLDAVTRGMDDLGAKDRHPTVGLDEARLLFTLALPTPERGHRWRVWRGGERGATGEVAGPPGLPEKAQGDPLRSPGPKVRVFLRDGRCHAVSVTNLEWAHDGSGRDILAFEEPIPGD